jgi:hypothetical protein
MYHDPHVAPHFTESACLVYSRMAPILVLTAGITPSFIRLTPVISLAIDFRKSGACSTRDSRARTNMVRARLRYRKKKTYANLVARSRILRKNGKPQHENKPAPTDTHK